MNSAYQWKSLNGDWQMARFPVGMGTPLKAEKASVIPCAVPGDIHIALQRSGEITDVLKGIEICRLEYLEKEEWWLQRTINISKKEADVTYRLHFGGIDVHGRIFLNGKLLGETENAFIPYEFDVTAIIQEGENKLLVAVDCGLYTLCKDDEGKRYHSEDPNAGNYEDYVVDMRRVLLRKPQFTYSWDWAKRLVTTGIWREVELRGYRRIAITDLYAQDEFDNENVTIVVESQTERLDAVAPLALRLSVDGFGEQYTQLVSIDETGKATARFSMKQPHLWFPNGYGDQPLYTISAEVWDGEDCLSSLSIRHGIRRLEFDQHFISQEEGYRFALQVNGVDVFCKGANWIPPDSVLANVTEEKYRTLLSEAQHAHYTMLRVWGGGIYESPQFYDLCDEYGILLWQDFMFANGYYPTDQPRFAGNIRRECTTIIRQLRNHASVAVWCGNNEIQWQHTILKAGISEFFGQDIYDDLLPELLQTLDGTRPYRHTSPYGRDEDVGSVTDGDTHSWYFWLGLDGADPTDYTSYLKDKTKFCSEYGVMSYPSFRTMKDYLCGYVTREQPAWKTHSNIQEQGLIARICNRYYIEDFDALPLLKQIHYSQYMQGDVYRRYMEHFACRAPACMGHLYWMYNDCWGCISWTCMDYYLRKKASWYMVKRAYSPVLASLLCQNNQLTVSLVQHTGREINQLRVRYGVAQLNGEMIWESTCELLNVPSAQGKQLVEKDLSEIDLTKVYGYVEVRNDVGETVYANQVFLTDYKKVALPQTKVTARLQTDGSDTIVRLMAEGYAANIFMEADSVVFSDNAFNMEPGRERIVYIQGTLPHGELSADVLNGEVYLIDERA